MRFVIIHNDALVEGIAGMIGIVLFREFVHDSLPIKMDVYHKIALAWGMTWLLRKISVNAYHLFGDKYALSDIAVNL